MTQLYQDLLCFDFASYDRIYSLYDPVYTLKGNSQHVAMLAWTLDTWVC